MQLSAVTGKALAVRPTLPTRLVPSLTKPRMVLSHAYVPYGPSESMEEEPVAPLTRRVTQEAARECPVNAQLVSLRLPEPWRVAAGLQGLHEARCHAGARSDGTAPRTAKQRAPPPQLQ